jgi:fructokinase
MILVCGEALIDMVPQKTETGENGFYPTPGGSPYNTAIAAGRLGTPVEFLGRFSKDFFGEILIQHLEKNHVGRQYIVRSGENTTLAFVKLEPGREPAYLFYTEGTADRSLTVEDLPRVLPPGTRCIVFGSIAMTMEPTASSIESFIFSAARSISKERPLISFDPNIRPFMIRDHDAYVKRFEQWAAVSSIVKISAADFAFIYPALDLEAALNKLLSLGPPLVLTTLGPQGALGLLRRTDGLLRVSAPVEDLPVADTIGAGDTFHGSFLAYLEMHKLLSPAALVSLSEQELYNALYFANKAASIVCSRHGADPPTLEEVENLSTADQIG